MYRRISSLIIFVLLLNRCVVGQSQRQPYCNPCRHTDLCCYEGTYCDKVAIGGMFPGFFHACCADGWKLQAFGENAWCVEIPKPIITEIINYNYADMEVNAVAVIDVVKTDLKHDSTSTVSTVHSVESKPIIIYDMRLVGGVMCLIGCLLCCIYGF